MPEISRFYGIVIKMFFKPKEHEPSHIHALYGEHIGIFDLTKITKNSPTSISGGMNWYFFVVKFLKMMYNIFSSNYMKGII